MADELEPPIKHQPLSESVQRGRADAQDAHEGVEPVARTRVEGHLVAYETALAILEGVHQRLADETDLGLDADTRLAGIWQLTGRCIGLGRALLSLVREGFCGEALPTARTAHECTRLLDAVADPDEDELVQKWLADEDSSYVRPRDARDAGERIEQRLHKRMREAGVEPPQEATPLTRQLYDRLSWGGHNRRRAIQDAVSIDLRTMARGPHPDPIVRAAYVEWAGAVVEEVVQSVGDALGRFFGPSLYEAEIKPLLQSFEAVRREMPLDAANLRSGSG